MALYCIRSGDTLGGIAARLGTSVEAILALNAHIADPDRIVVGGTLNLPETDKLAGSGGRFLRFAEQPGGEAPWFEIARRELVSGIEEIPGGRHNPRIVEYHQCSSLKASDDETPWCSSFANWCMAQAGIAGSGSAAARSWLAWGVPLAAPRRGCVVVLSRGAPPSGHVGFLERLEDGLLFLLGGNQGDRVSIAAFRAGRLLGYRWPTA